MKFEIAITPCPNDTYVYYHLNKSNVGGYAVRLIFADIEELNKRALQTDKSYIVTKVSAALYPKIKNTYELLPCGGVFTDSGGPMLISYNPKSDQLIETVITPGEFTTANLLLQKYLAIKQPEQKVKIIHCRYDEIFSSMLQGKADFGVVIHEDRFVYQEHGFYPYQDLGEWWHSTVDAPLPLGLLVAHRNLKKNLRQELINKIRESLNLAHKNPKDVFPFIKKYAANKDEKIIQQHIQLFINDYTREINEKCLFGLEKLTED